MEKKDWSVFNDTIKNNFNTIDVLFSNNELVLENKKVEIEKNDAKENQKEFEEWKKKLIGVIEVKEAQKLDNLLSDNRELLKKREDAIGRLNHTVEGLKSDYSNAKQSYDKARDEIKKLIEDKESWLDIMSEAIRIQHNDNEVTKEKQKEVVKKKKGEIDCQYGCTIVGSCILFACCLAVQVFLFEIMGLEEASWHAEEIGIYIAVVAMIVCLVCEVFLVRGIVRLSKKKNYILQRLDLILNKIDMRKVTKFEIDRDLEKVLEEMK